MRFEGTCYRGHDPRWAFDPLSGEGARLKGGRFNPKGQAALYLALSIEGLFLELSHGMAHRFEPLVVCSYEVDVADVADLRTDAGRKQHAVQLNEMRCAWALDVAQGREPASWKLAKRLTRDGAAGALVPSFARGAKGDRHHNLVLWRWGPDVPHRVTLYDPNTRLKR